MNVTVTNLRRAAGLVLLGLLVPGGSLIVLVTLLTDRLWPRHRPMESSHPSQAQQA